MGFEYHGEMRTIKAGGWFDSIIPPLPKGRKEEEKSEKLEKRGRNNDNERKNE